MARTKKEKEFWIIPKRANLHQVICVLDGIMKRDYNGTVWNTQKQNNLGVNLKNWGATKDGKNKASQSIRTLIALVQYLGFIYKDETSEPTKLWVTEAGRELWKRHSKDLVKIPNLMKDKDKQILESELVLRQMEKLQITNPFTQDDCQNVYLFPFRFMLKVMSETEYLDIEEIAYFLFSACGEDKKDDVVKGIGKFRKLTLAEREDKIDSFKTTKVGRIALGKASSADYYIRLCLMTGIIERFSFKPENRSRKIKAIRVKEEYKKYAADMLEKYEAAEVYDFADNIKLWAEYIGSPKRDFPPIDVTLTNDSNADCIIQVIRNGKCLYGDLFVGRKSLLFPMFAGEEYLLKFISPKDGSEISSAAVIPELDNRKFKLYPYKSAVKTKKETFADVAALIEEHCSAAYFTGETLEYLNTLQKVTGVDRTKSKALRGAYLELYFYRLLSVLKKDKVIDKVVWNGKTGEYGLPVSAPGGKDGNADLIFVIDNKHFVLELTSIKAKGMQFSTEASSVPDHIRIYRDKTKEDVVGIFCAPVIHRRNEAIMTAAASSYGIKLNNMTNTELVELLATYDREKIKSGLV